MDTPVYPNTVVPISDRIEIVSILLQRLKREGKDFSNFLRRQNSWGENILHVAVASDYMGDEDTCTLLEAVFAILGEDIDYSELINAKNEGGVSVLGYSTALGKEKTLDLLQAKLVPENRFGCH